VNLDDFAAWEAQLSEPVPNREEALAAIIAATDVVGRSGAKETQLYFENGFHAVAIFPGRRVIVSEYPNDPAGAADELARRVIHNGRCTSCRKIIVAEDRRPLAMSVTLPDGTVEHRTKPERTDLCFWDRVGERWERECGPAAPEDSTRERLAQALIGEGYVHAAMIAAARAARYDAYLQDVTPFPLMLLVEDLRQYGTKAQAITARVMNGEFDGTKEEGDAWAASPDGQETFAELAAGVKGRNLRTAPESYTSTPKTAGPGKDAGRAAAERARRKRRQ
jgi:hypothetical protein